jgi:hypothetical protein|tara:strand:- start:3162 stop:3548 length:387 start_codon:yes stop_codon:yes gene_type:complete
MSFNAGRLQKNDDGNYWVGDIDPNDEELDLTLANSNMRQVFATLGYPTDLEEQSPFPIDEFIGRTTQWLQKAIDKQSPEEPTAIDKNPGGPTMISGGKPEGYFNMAIKDMNKIARAGKEAGATHIWAS